MIHRAQIMNIGASGAALSNGEHATAIGNNPMYKKTYDIWTDGTVVYGNHIPRGGGGNVYIPPAGIPVSTDRLLGYIDDDGNFRSYPVLSGGIVNDDRRADVSDIEDIDADIDKDGGIWSITHGVITQHAFPGDRISYADCRWTYSSAFNSLVMNMPVYGVIALPGGVSEIPWCEELLVTNNGETVQDIKGKWVLSKHSSLDLQWQPEHPDTPDEHPAEIRYNGQTVEQIDMQPYTRAVKEEFERTAMNIQKKLDNKKGIPWPEKKPERPEKPQLMMVRSEVVNGKIGPQGEYWLLIDACAGGYIFPYLTQRAMLWQYWDEVTNTRVDAGIPNINPSVVPDWAWYDRVNIEDARLTKTRTFDAYTWYPMEVRVHMLYLAQNGQVKFLCRKTETETVTVTDYGMGSGGGQIPDTYSKTVRNWFWLMRDDECVSRSSSHHITHEYHDIKAEDTAQYDSEELTLPLEDGYSAVLNLKDKGMHDIIDLDGNYITSDIPFGYRDNVTVGQTQNNIYVVGVRHNGLYTRGPSGVIKLDGPEQKEDKGLNNYRLRRMENVTTKARQGAKIE